MRYLSVCSGIEAATVAWLPLGWKAVAFAEIEPFTCALLEHHYPDVPNLGDMTKTDDWNYHHRVDVLVGGTPCQSFSVAGLRRGLNDERGNLALEFVRLADECDPDFVVWENVLGVLSDRGNAFGCFLAALAGDCAPLPTHDYRILAQNFEQEDWGPRAGHAANRSCTQMRVYVCALSHIFAWFLSLSTKKLYAPSAHSSL